MARDDAALNDVLAQIYLELHLAASGKIKSTDFSNSKLTREQAAILAPIKFVRASSDFETDLPKDAQDALLAKNSKENDPKSIKATSSNDLLLRRMERYQGFAEGNLMMLCILSFSPTFRSACEHYKPLDWQSLTEKILENFESIEYFAKVRGLKWINLLQESEEFYECVMDQRNASLGERHFHVHVQHPHTMVVPGGRGRLRLPMHEGRVQQIISENKYREDLFSDPRFERPSRWPEEWAYPCDPSARPDGSTCANCKSTDMCGCQPSDLIQEPLVELRQYSKYGARGIGIRTLQRIKKDTYLAEYLGEILPTSNAYPLTPNGRRAFREFDVVYSWELSRGNDDLAQVSSAFYGNWTRYVNHSCEPLVKVRFEAVGDKVHIFYKAAEDIEPFEELTVHYGNLYFNAERPCKCGTASCREDFAGNIG